MISHTSCSVEAQVEIGASQTAGTADDSGPYPQVRDLLAGDASTHATLAVVSGLSGGPEAEGEGEQTLLDTMITRYPGVFTSDRIWVLDRNFPGADRIARMLATGTHGAETALKEAKSATSGMRRSIRRPDPALQNPWAHRSGARRLDLRHRAGPRACSCGRPPAAPARKGRHAGQQVQPRQISFTTARRAGLNSTPSGAATGSLPAAITAALHRGTLYDLGNRQIITGQNRHRDRKTKTCPAFPAAGRGITTRAAAAQVSVCRPAGALTTVALSAPCPELPDVERPPAPGATARPGPMPVTLRNHSPRRLRSALKASTNADHAQVHGIVYAPSRLHFGFADFHPALL